MQQKLSRFILTGTELHQCRMDNMFTANENKFYTNIRTKASQNAWNTYPSKEEIEELVSCTYNKKRTNMQTSYDNKQ